MNYLLDTNVICELVKPKPDKSVINFIFSLEHKSMYISVLTLGEIRKGISGISEKGKREKIILWLESELPAYFAERVLNIDEKIADQWGELQSRIKGRNMPAIDALIAATAEVHKLSIVTRNIKDFTNTKARLINPWA